MTAGSPPTQPAPPTVVEAGVKYLSLEWRALDTDDEYTLQMEDPSTGHGFLPVYNGNAPHYLCIDLRRNSQYRFRVSTCELSQCLSVRPSCQFSSEENK